MVSEGGRLGRGVESSLPRVLGKTLVKLALYIVGLLITWRDKVNSWTSSVLTPPDCETYLR